MLPRAFLCLCVYPRALCAQYVCTSSPLAFHSFVHFSFHFHPLPCSTTRRPLPSQTPTGCRRCCRAPSASQCACASVPASAWRVRAPASAHRRRRPRSSSCLECTPGLTLSLSLLPPRPAVPGSPPSSPSSHLASSAPADSPSPPRAPPGLLPLLPPRSPADSPSPPGPSRCRHWPPLPQPAGWTATRPAAPAWPSSAARGPRASATRRRLHSRRGPTVSHRRPTCRPACRTPVRTELQSKDFLSFFKDEWGHVFAIKCCLFLISSIVLVLCWWHSTEVGLWSSF